MNRGFWFVATGQAAQWPIYSEERDVWHTPLVDFRDFLAFVRDTESGREMWGSHQDLSLRGFGREWFYLGIFRLNRCMQLDGTLSKDRF